MKKELVILGFAFIGLFVVNSAQAQGTTVASGNCGAQGNNLTWVLTSDSVLTISGSGAMADYTYSSPWYSSYRHSIKEVVIGDSVTSIGNYAFYQCPNIISVTIPNSVITIGNYAFRNNNNLVTAIIPNSVITIGNYAFSGCIRLESTMISNSVITIGHYAFSGCVRLDSITIPNSVITIGTSAFAECSNLNSVIIGNSVITIGNSAFYLCRNLTVVSIPNSVKSIGSESFRLCSSLPSINIPNSVTSIGQSAFEDCSNLVSVIISDSVTIIENSTFYSCSSLTSVTIPSSVTSIRAYVFYSCSSLTSITIPNSVTSIGWATFFNCSNLTSITIGSGVTSIDDHAFSSCCGLTSITSHAITPPTLLGLYTFRGIPDTIPFYVPCQSYNSYRNAFGWKYFTNFANFTEFTDTNFVFDTTCSGITYNNNGFSISTGTGVYYRTNICGDSTVCLTLTEYSYVPITYYSDTICRVSNYIGNHFTNLTQTGVYYDTLQSINGCDSIICLSLFVDVAITYYSASICKDSTYTDSNFTNLTQAGIYYDTIQAINGCDSIVCLRLTVSPAIAYYYSAVYNGGSYTDNHFTNLTQAGVYYDTLQNVNGCDSIVCLTLFSPSQSTGSNLDFSFGTLANWQCYSGTCSGGNYITVPVMQIPGKHSVMNASALMQVGQFYDEYCPTIPKVPDGYNFSCRIGNSGIGAEVDGIEYELAVDSSNSFLTVHFAYIFEDPGHAYSDQPQFIIKIKDSTGKVLNYIDFTTNNMQGLACYTNNLIARNWTKIGYNLEPYIGQKIKLYLETWDCTLSGHFGYAYALAEAHPMQTDYVYCTKTVSLNAPNGFSSYLWTRNNNISWSDTAREINVLNPQDGEVFTCTINQEFGSTIQLKKVTIPTQVDADFLYGVKDKDNHVDFVSSNYQSWYDTCSQTATFVDLSFVMNNKKTFIQWEIPDLNAVSYDSLFTYTFPVSGTTPVMYRVHLTANAGNGCMDTFSQLITINPLSVFIIYDSATICQGKTYSDDNFTNLTQAGTYYDTLQSIYGCDSIIICLTLCLADKDTTIINAIICEKETYQENGFNESASGTYLKHLQNIYGCDSIVILNLTISDVGIVEMRHATSLRVYPNPTDGQLRIANYELREDAVIEIYDVVGRLYTPLPPLKGGISPFEGGRGMSEITIDISHLANGMYYLRIGEKVAKFVKE